MHCGQEVVVVQSAADSQLPDLAMLFEGTGRLGAWLCLRDLDHLATEVPVI